MKNAKQRIAELEDDLKQRDARIKELIKERDEERELVVQMREQVEQSQETIEQWKEGFGMVLNDDGKWEIPDSLHDDYMANVADYIALVGKWNKIVAEYNAVVAPRNVGRPLAASEAQVATVLKLHKAGKSLRWIADETSLGLGTVRTIIDKGNGTDRATMRRLERIAPDKFMEATLKRCKRSRDALPKRIEETQKRGAELLREAKDRR